LRLAETGRELVDATLFHMRAGVTFDKVALCVGGYDGRDTPRNGRPPHPANPAVGRALVLLLDQDAAPFGLCGTARFSLGGSQLVKESIPFSPGLLLQRLVCSKCQREFLLYILGREALGIWDSKGVTKVADTADVYVASTDAAPSNGPQEDTRTGILDVR